MKVIAVLAIVTILAFATLSSSLVVRNPTLVNRGRPGGVIRSSRDVTLKTREPDDIAEIRPTLATRQNGFSGSHIAGESTDIAEIRPTLATRQSGISGSQIVGESIDIAEVRKLNADDAEELQKKFETFTVNQVCKPNETSCIGKDFAKCATVFGDNGKLVNKFQLQPCSGGLKCAVLPLVLKRGTSITCTTEQDRKDRLKQARKNL